MADDKSGISINIPSFLISQKDGEILKEALNKNPKEVYLQGEIEMVHPDNRVEYELWYSSVMDLDPNNIFDLGQHMMIFKDDTYFTPRIMTYSCETCESDFKQRECLSDGKFCVLRPKDHHKFQYEQIGITGADILMESLR